MKTAVAINMNLFGDKQLRRNFFELSDKVRRKLARRAARAATRPIVRAAKARAPVDTGALRDSIGVRSIKMRPRSETSLIIVGPLSETTFRWKTAGGEWRSEAQFGAAGTVKRNPAKYAHLVEFGRKFVTPTQGRVMITEEGQIIGRRARGVRPRPFMRPAIDSASGKAIERARKNLAKNIIAETRKLAQRTR